MKEGKKGTITMPRPGFEPGLLRPQRNVLTTIRSRLFMPRITRWTWVVKFSFFKTQRSYVIHSLKFRFRQSFEINLHVHA